MPKLAHRSNVSKKGRFQFFDDNTPYARTRNLDQSFPGMFSVVHAEGPGVGTPTGDFLSFIQEPLSRRRDRTLCGAGDWPGVENSAGTWKGVTTSVETLPYARALGFVGQDRSACMGTPAVIQVGRQRETPNLSDIPHSILSQRQRQDIILARSRPTPNHAKKGDVQEIHPLVQADESAVRTILI